jgi:hypothetical protein
MSHKGSLRVGLAVLGWLLFGLGTVWAQTGAIAGVVRDTSGSVLPGVTVEASSPALIERVRTVVTDGEGQYKILNLRPGLFAVNFALSGFRTVRREGIELSAGGTANVSVDMQVGALEETILVSGQAPLVDVQNTTQHRVISQDVMKVLPAGGSVFGFAALIPGMNLQAVTSNSPRDIGGMASGSTMAVSIHGSRLPDAANLFDGLRTNNLLAGGGGTNSSWNANAYMAQEVVVDVAGHTAEALVSGPRVNAIPREGGNTFRGTIVGNFSSKNLQATNISPDLVARGVGVLPSMDKLAEVSAVLGGPIVRDKLWFFGGVRRSQANNFIPGTYYAKDPLAFTYTPDLNRPAIYENGSSWEDLRLTWQASPRNKFGFYGDNQTRLQPHQFLAATFTPEASARLNYPPSYVFQTTYNSPVTNRLLIEAGTSYGGSAYNQQRQPDQPADLLGITELSTNLRYRSYVVFGPPSGRQRVFFLNFNTRAKISYVTGSHALQVGMQSMHGYNHGFYATDGSDIQAYFLNGVPAQVQVSTTPFEDRNTLNYDLGLFAQDQWTVKRLTLNLGIRFNFLKSSVPEQHLPAVKYVGPRDFAAIDNVPNWKDYSPRLGATYDPFGNGKTALKVHLGKYVESAGIGLPQKNNPLFSTINSTTRSWNDRNGDFIPNEDELGPPANPNFGKLNPVATYDPDYLQGWGKRGYSWEVLTGVTREITPGLSVSADYVRHWYGNMLTDINTAVGPSDFSPFCVPVPVDPRLPGGGGNQLCGFYDINPNKFGAFRQVTTLAKNYGNVTDVYNGVDLTINMRLQHGIILQGGTSTGHEVWDNCDIVGKVNQQGGTIGLSYGVAGSNPSGLASPSNLFCHVAPEFQTQFKLLGTVPLPKGVTVSATFQSIPGDLRAQGRVVDGVLATWAVPNALIAPSLGRPLSGGAQFATVQLIQPGSIYGDRVNQFDIRSAKTFRVGRARIQALVDVYNVFNSNAVLQQNDAYGPAWQKPITIMPGRFVKFGTTIDF